MSEGVYVPSSEELQRCVVPRRKPLAGHEIPESAPETGHAPAGEPDAAATPPLSMLAALFLNHAAHPHNRELSLEARWKDLGVTSGAVKGRVLSELRRLGFIRLERKGRYQLLHLYSKAWDYLGLAPPTGEGVGGPVHKATVRRLAKAFRKRGYEVHLEHAIGESGKRVDLVCFGRDGILGVEVGLSDVHQEMKNLRDDLAANVLDRILFVSCDPGMVRKVRAAARIDPAVSKHMERIRFLYFEEESP
ncbi:MAG TPA: hypothetical protein PKN69_04165 [Candidatus Latescibacteria bacterium]|jgi:hypothetical protein|nr:hypothetical protein [Candidatus Latescibacterota bacterium]